MFMGNIFEQYRRWFVLAGLMLIYAASSGIIVHTLPLLYPPLIEEFGWSITQMTLPARGPGWDFISLNIPMDGMLTHPELVASQLITLAESQNHAAHTHNVELSWNRSDPICVSCRSLLTSPIAEPS